MEGDGTLTEEITVGGWPIRAELTKLDDGLHILLTGGCKSHIGSVTVAEPDGAEQTIALPGHREAEVSRCWAAALARRYHCRAVVVCGIHYDNLTRPQLVEVLTQLEQMLCRIQDIQPLEA